MISMIETHEILEIYRTKRMDIIPFIVTFGMSLWLGLEFGIIAGVLANMLLILYMTSRPRIDYKVVKVSYCFLTSRATFYMFLTDYRLMTWMYLLSILIKV